MLQMLEVCREARELEMLVGTPVVAALRAADVSWIDISKALGLSRQAAWDRYRNAEGTLDPSVLPASLLAAAATPSSREPDLEVGRVYTRVELQRVFTIRDATLKNGVFLMRRRSEIWLFVTANKQADRTQFRDRLVGDTLEWEGQTAGRTDALITNHVADGNAIVLFYRDSKNEHPGAGFVCEGRFQLSWHDTNVRPGQFIFKREH